MVIKKKLHLIEDFLTKNNISSDKLVLMKSDASHRRYHRLYNQEESMILMDDQEFINLSDDQVSHIDEIDISQTDALVAGSGLMRYPDIKIDSKSLLRQSGEEYLNSKTMIDHALEQFNKGNTIDCMNLKPNYLFDEVAN